MIGTLLTDLAAGHALAEVRKRFAAKMHPLRYQRPQAAPAAGNLEQAEKLVAALGLAPALKRRFARLEDVEALWTPAPPLARATTPGGVFAHLKPLDASRAEVRIEAPETRMTWDKFSRAVLPGALRIEYYVPTAARTYVALTTAIDPDAPPILQWDAPERRNPVAWYVYHRGSGPAQWNLRAGAWVDVTAACLLPCQWGQAAPRAHWGEGAILLLEGSRDAGYERGGALFPEILRGELHGVRATLEAYARDAVIAGADEATACGIDLRRGGAWDCAVRVTTALGRARYRLDRWD